MDEILLTHDQQCDACGHAWQGVVEIPIESTYPQVPLECSECHQMMGGPA